jgi:predicted dienelactone hydrolase
MVLVAPACGGDSGGAGPAPTPAATDTTIATPTTAPPPPPSTAATTVATSPAPTSFDEPGPYAAGVRTISLADREVEVWYPVAADAVAGRTSEVFDTLSVFPESLQPLIPAELQGEVDTGAYRDAPLWTADAPYPVVIYSHGFGGYRQAATNHTTHLASWGYVVLSVDHLERGIAAQATGTLGGPPDQDVTDVRNALAAVAADPDLGPVVDLDRVAITGHSAGAGTAARAAAAIDAVDGFVSVAGGLPAAAGTTGSSSVPMAAPTTPGLVVAADGDDVVAPSRSRALYDALSSDDRWYVEIAGAGHNSFTDSCQRIRELGGLGALVPLIGEAQAARAEDGCLPENTPPGVVQRVLDHYTVAFLRRLFDQPVGDEALTAEAVRSIDGVALVDFRAG